MSENVTVDNVQAWMGEFARDLSEDQLAQFVWMARRYEEEYVQKRPFYGTEDYCADDHFAEDNHAWQMIHQLILREVTPRELVRDLRMALIVMWASGEKLKDLAEETGTDAKILQALCQQDY